MENLSQSQENILRLLFSTDLNDLVLGLQLYNSLLKSDKSSVFQKFIETCYHDSNDDYYTAVGYWDIICYQNRLLPVKYSAYLRINNNQWPAEYAPFLDFYNSSNGITNVSFTVPIYCNPYGNVDVLSKYCGEFLSNAFGKYNLKHIGRVYKDYAGL